MKPRHIPNSIHQTRLNTLHIPPRHIRKRTKLHVASIRRILSHRSTAILPIPLRPHLLLCLQSPQQKAHYAFLYASQHDHRSAVEARNVAMAIHMADQRAHGRDSSRRWFGRRRSPVGRVKSLVGTLRRQVRRSISLGKQRVLSPSVHGSGWREKHTPAFGRYGIP